MLTAKTVGAARSLSRSWTHPRLGVTSAQRCGLSSIFFDHLFTVPTLRLRQCLFQSFGAISPPAKVKIPPQRLPNSVLWISFGRGNELQIYHENFLLMNHKHRKLFVDEKSKRCIFMPKSARMVSGCIHCIHILLEIEKGSLQWKTVCEICICS